MCWLVYRVGFGGDHFDDIRRSSTMFDDIYSRLVSSCLCQSSRKERRGRMFSAGSHLCAELQHEKVGSKRAASPKKRRLAFFLGEVDAAAVGLAG